VAAAALFVPPALVSAQTAATPAKMAKTESPQAAAQRDGQQDFDWIIGAWKVQLKRLQRPLTGSTTWVEYEGRSVVRKVWDGRANLDEITADSPATHAHMEGLTLRLYNPETRQWSLYWANAKTGALGMPATVGQFTNGRGEFYDEEEFEGRAITVRYLWTDITPTSARFEQAFSTDGRKTWETNWIAMITRAKE
jgi:hypothetical protein